ncbi:MAG TPA: AMP-binding protein [Candidatus Kapabacteria bacterium]|nr:AMP-binding protein [Candidatus Kapabacteria bacterium]
MNDERFDIGGEDADYFNLGFDVVDSLARSARNRLAFLRLGADGERDLLTYWELSAGSNRVANVLRGLGIRARDVLLLVMPRTSAWCAAALGAIKRGAVIALADPDATGEELAGLCAAVRPRAIVADSACAPAVDRMRDALASVGMWIVSGGARAGWTDLDAACAASSGTLLHMGFDEMTRPADPMLCVPFSTADGEPRIALHSHAQMRAQRAIARNWFGIDGNDIHWTLAPRPWTSLAWPQLFAEWMAGATAVVHDAAAAVDPRDLLRVIAALGVTSFCTTPDLYRAIVSCDMKAYDLGTLRSATCAGALDAATIEAWKDGTEGLEPRSGLGRADTGLLAWIPPGGAARAGCYGTGGDALAVTDERGTPLGHGVQGRLAVRVFPAQPPGVALRLADPHHDAAAFLGDWFVTDERVVMADDGTIRPAAPAQGTAAQLVYTIAPPGS